MRRVRASGILAAVLLLGGAAARARADDQHPEGQYGGVTPGQPPPGPAPGEKSKRPRHPPAKDELTWVGFQAKDGAATLFFQAPAGFTASQRVEKGELVVVLDGLHTQVRNTRRPIDTRWFDSPIARVTARVVAAHGKRGVEVRIAFKNPKDAREGQLRTATESDGMFYAYLDVSGGGATTAAPKDEPSGPGDSADGKNGDTGGSSADDGADAPDDAPAPKATPKPPAKPAKPARPARDDEKPPAAK